MTCAMLSVPVPVLSVPDFFLGPVSCDTCRKVVILWNGNKASTQQGGIFWWNF